MCPSQLTTRAGVPLSDYKGLPWKPPNMLYKDYSKIIQNKIRFNKCHDLDLAEICLAFLKKNSPTMGEGKAIYLIIF